MARPSKLCKEIIDELCEWVEDDVPFRYCAEGCGITYVTFLNWMQKGEKDYEAEVDSLESDLFYRIKKSYAKVVRESVRIIRSGMVFKVDKKGNIIYDEDGKTHNWQGECWIRQRRDNEFMDKQEIVNNDEKVIVQLGNIKGRHIKGERDDVSK